MNSTQKGLEILSNNVSNAGTPGYHRQTLGLIDKNTIQSSFVNSAGVKRAFIASLQKQYSVTISSLGYSDLRATYLAQIEQLLGKPGDVAALSTVYQNFENSLQTLVTSPDDYATRANVVSNAQNLVETLNRLTKEIQTLRTDSETQLADNVNNLNKMLSSLADINNKLRDFSVQDSARLALLDERDRLVADISELVDVRVEYRSNDSVALMTNAGLGLLDNGATIFEFTSAGILNANSQFSVDKNKNKVGTLIATTPSGYQINVIEQNMISSGRIGALIEMRDISLVELQGQLDDIAASISQALSTITIEGNTISGPPDGFSADLANMQSGNEFTFSYSVNSQEQNVRIIRVDDNSKLPLDYVDPNGKRVIGLDFSSGIGAVVSALNSTLGPAITFSNPSGSIIEIVDDGLAGTSDVNSLSVKINSNATQGSGLALSLFVDQGNSSFTNSLDGEEQIIGYAGRISVNSEILADNELLVKYDSSTSLGDTARAEFLLNSLENMSFLSTKTSSANNGTFRLNGTAGEMITQMMSYQGSNISAAYSTNQTNQLSMDAVNLRIKDEYGVNIDEEMARLMELQNAYAASARIVSVVQELLDSLMRI